MKLADLICGRHGRSRRVPPGVRSRLHRCCATIIRELGGSQPDARRGEVQPLLARSGLGHARNYCGHAALDRRRAAAGNLDMDLRTEAGARRVCQTGPDVVLRERQAVGANHPSDADRRVEGHRWLAGGQVRGGDYRAKAARRPCAEPASSVSTRSSRPAFSGGSNATVFGRHRRAFRCLAVPHARRTRPAAHRRRSTS